MSKMFAYYEMTTTGWSLVVYHDEPPQKAIGRTEPRRIGPYEVPEDMQSDGSPLFGKIARAFPNPEVPRDPDIDYLG